MRGVLAFCLIILVIPGLVASQSTTVHPVVTGNNTENVSATTIKPIVTGNNTENVSATTIKPIVTGNNTENVITTTIKPIVTGNNTENVTATTIKPIVTGNNTENVITTTIKPIVTGNNTENVITTTIKPIVTGNNTENVITTTIKPIVTGNNTENVITTTIKPIVTGNNTENVITTTINPGVTGNNTDNVTATTVDPGNSTENGNSTEPTKPSIPDVTGGPESTTALTTTKPESCASGVCGNGSKCLQLYQTYECQCPLNYHYDATDRICRAGESFYGEFLITGVNFDSNPNSAEYTDLYNKVMNASNASLSGLDGYLGTVIVKISAVSSKSQTRSRRSTVNVAVIASQIFSKGTTTAQAVIDAFTDNTLGTYSTTDICAIYCDGATTTCEATTDGQGATCTCLDGYYSSSAENMVKSCRDCSPDCYANEKKYCNTATTQPTCDCRPGYKTNGDACQDCDFGYSGVDCADNYLLILVIVAAVLGAAVIALLGAVIGVSVSSKKGKKYEDRAALIKKDETIFGDSSPAPTRLFPKVQAKSDLGEVNKVVNVYNDDEEYSRNFPKRDYEENPWYEMARKERNY